MKKLVPSRFNYLVRFETALIASLSLFILIFRMDYYPENTEEVLQVYDQEIVQIEETIQTKQELVPPPPPKPVIPIEVPNDEILEEEIIFMSSELDIDDYNPISLPAPPPVENEEKDDEMQVFVVVEQPPVLIGGYKALQKNVKYPDFAVSASIEGKVIVQFIIDANGNVKNPFVVRGIGAGCDEEALRVIKTAKFKPGMQRGKAVAVEFTIPIIFKLKDSD